MEKNKDRRKSDRRKIERPEADRRKLYRLFILNKYKINWIKFGNPSEFELKRGKNA